MMTKAAEQAIRGGVTAVAATMLALALAPSGAFAAACPPAILKCGCTISAPGTYTLSGPNPMLLNSTEGATCVHITANDVTLVGGSTLQGPGSSKTSTIGVHVDIFAKGASLQSVEATNFGQGILIDGPNATVREGVTSFNNKGTVVNGVHALLIEQSSNRDGTAGILVNGKAKNFEMMSSTANGATGAGIELNGVSGAVLTSTVAKANVTFGIWLKSSSNNLLSTFDTEDNGTAGVYLGCNAAGPNGKSCPISSNGNNISGGTISGMGGILLQQSYGIAVGKGNNNNVLLGIRGTGNVVDDAFDENPSCGTNRWLTLGDILTTTNPIQINHYPGCGL
jgi:copper-binding protein NosD